MKSRKIISTVVLSGLIVTMLPLSGNDGFNLVEAKAISETVNTNSISLAPTIALANGINLTKEATVTNSKVETKKTLEEIVILTKEKLKIGNEYTEFNSYFYENGNHGIWELSWGISESKYDINVRVNDKGNIEYYHKNTKTNGTPEFLVEELVDKAWYYVMNFEPSIVDYLVLDYEQIQSNSNTYGYYFHRVEGGIPVENEGITIHINNSTGNITSYVANYDFYVEVPSKETKITKNKAKELLDGKIDMVLKYKSQPYYMLNSGKKVEAFLVYEPTISNLSVDALTGEVYTETINWNYTSVKNSTAESSLDVATSTGLTNVEYDKINEVNSLITKEEAIKIIKNNKFLSSDASAVSVNTRLSEKKDGENKEYVWNISFLDPRPYGENDYYRAYISASVDAKTGNILSYYASEKPSYNYSEEQIQALKPIYTQENNKKKLEEFLKEEIGSIFEHTQLASEGPGNSFSTTTGQKVVDHNFSYVRIENKVPYENNNIYASVDAITGKLKSFSYNWNTNISFQSTGGVMSKSKAYDYYMGQENLVLMYEKYYEGNVAMDIYTSTPKLRLVYKNQLDSHMISPFSGEELFNNGKVSLEENTRYSYDDISGLAFERKIRILGDLGIGFEGNKFNPKKEVTGVELAKLIDKVSYYNASSIKVFQSEKNLTRLQAVEGLIEILGYESVSNIGGIYQVDFTDKSSIKENMVGKVAIIEGLGILSTNEKDEFRGTAPLTRLESIEILIALQDIVK